MRGTHPGRTAGITGSAWKQDPSSPDAKFTVRFVVPPFFPIIPVKGDYFVLFVDDAYEKAIVGEPTRRSCWILSRTPTMDDATYDAMLARISEAGYPEGCMKRTKQVWEEGASGPGEGATKRDGGVWWLKGIMDFSKGVFAR